MNIANVKARFKGLFSNTSQGMSGWEWLHFLTEDATRRALIAKKAREARMPTRMYVPKEDDFSACLDKTIDSWAHRNALFKARRPALKSRKLLKARRAAQKSRGRHV
jgi:hypothetical protein